MPSQRRISETLQVHEESAQTKKSCKHTAQYFNVNWFTFVNQIVSVSLVNSSGKCCNC